MTRWSLAVLVLVALTASGCSPTTNPVRDVFSSVGAGPPPAEMPEFVTQTRPAELEYIPVGGGQQPRAAARTRDEVAKLEAELEAERARNESQGAATRRAGAAVRPVTRRAP